MRVKCQYRLTSKDNYEKFCIENDEFVKENNITFDTWLRIHDKFTSSIIGHILETGEKVKLPYGLGVLSINKVKTVRTKTHKGKTYYNLPIDWVKTKQEGKYIYNMNYHTDGYKYYWQWFKEDCRFYKSDLWWFKASRVVSRAIANKIKNNYDKNHNNYYSQLYNQWIIKKTKQI